MCQHPLEVHRGELSKDEALLAVRLLQAADIEFLPVRSLLEASTQMAFELDHPAYDCVYVALAAQRDSRFVTADERFVRKLGEGHRYRFRGRVIGLRQAVAALGGLNPPEQP
jgi:predicted nucleic acid-binding protein